MRDEDKTQEQLIGELQILRQRLSVLEQAEAERQQTQERLDEKEARLRLLMEQLPVTVWATDHDLRITESTGAGLAALGLRPHQVVGQTLFEYFQNDDPAFWAFVQQRRALAGESVSSEVDWQGRSYQTRLEPLRNRSGHIIGSVGVSIDITERRQAERAFQASEERFKAFLDNSPAPVWIKDAQFRYVYRNKRSEMRFRKSHEECLGKTVFEVWPEAVARTMWETDRAVLESDRPAVFPESIPTPEGELHHWLVYKFPFQDAERKRFVAGMAVDLTEQKKAEQDLRNSEALYHSLVDCLPLSIYRKSLDGRFTFANQRFCISLGRLLDEILGKTDVDFFPTDLAAKYRRDDQRVIETKHVFQEEEQFALPDGRRITIEVVKSPVYDGEGQVIGTQGIFWDITERKLLHEQLINSQRMEAVGHLAAGIAHDFRNLLTAIIGNMALVEEEVAGTTKALVAEALKASERAVTLVNQLLLFSRKAPLAISAIDLGPVLDEVVNMARKTFDRRVEVRLEAPAELRVLADPGQVHQAILNLLINARDALAEVKRQGMSAEIVVKVTIAEIDASYCEKHLPARPGQYARISVSDNGVGMDGQTQQRMFDPFFTTKEVGKGTGLGLASTWNIVQRHGGWIEVESELGQGTTVTFYLPLDQSRGKEKPAKPTSEDALRGGKETILLVDDEDIVRTVGKRILERYGYTVVEARDGQEAVDLYLRRAAEFDLVLLDLSMPRLSGEEALTHLWLHNPAIKVIVASGLFTEADAERLRQKGAVTLVGKPYRVSDLVRAVRLALDIDPAR